MFGKHLERYFKSILATEPYFLTQLPISAQNHQWLVTDTAIAAKKISGSVSDDTTMVPLYGLDPRGVRDWNEEYQVVKDFP